MRAIFIVALVLLVGTVAFSEDYQCGAEGGCPARINRDGEIVEETFRKGDLISTDAGWLVSPDDGWVKIQDNRSYAQSGQFRGAQVLFSAVNAGTSLQVGQNRYVWVYPTGQQNSTGSSGSSGSYSASWKSDTDGSGPRTPITITVSYEQQPGETSKEAAKKFQNKVDAAMDLFPPNVPE